MGYAAAGTLIKIGDGGSPESFTTIAEVVNIGGPDFTLETSDTTNHSSPSFVRQAVGTLIDAGEIPLVLNFRPANATQDYTTGLLSKVFSREETNFQLVLPDDASTTWTLPCLVTNFKVTANVDDKLQADCTLKVVGAPTLA